MSDPLAPLRTRFRARLVDDLAHLKKLMQSGATAELRVLAHNLAGGGGAFGFPALSAAAVTIDDRYALGQAPRPQDLATLEAELVAIIED